MAPHASVHLSIYSLVL
nr:unnamed protein product [Callosobruchus chinensis]